MLKLVLIALFTLSASGMAFAGDWVKDEISRQIIEASPWEDSDVEVTEVEVSGIDAMEGRFDGIRIEAPKGVRSLGKVTVQAVLLKSGVPVKALWASARIRVFKDAVIAITPIKRGRKIQASDLAVKRIEARDAWDLPAAIGDVLGKVSARSIAAGAVIKTGYLKDEAVIRRGDHIEIFMEDERIKIKTKGVATEDGAVGAVIAARSLTGRELRARVTGPGEAVLDF
jgi:flagella basal body P-ring formation protein FlgA